MNKGTIIYLNGVTSTGKTSISRELQQQSDKIIYNLSNDMIAYILDRNRYNNNYWETLFNTIYIMYDIAVMLAEKGHDVIIDGMIVNPPGITGHYEHIKNVFSASNLIIVEVFCPLEECKRRNIVRGDRGVDQSDNQYKTMVKDVVHDFSVNTLLNDSNTCARQILEFISSL